MEIGIFYKLNPWKSTADMVFPSFPFINGMSIYLAIKPSMKNDKMAWFRIIKRVSAIHNRIFVEFTDKKF
jgi:predicted acyltransferase